MKVSLNELIKTILYKFESEIKNDINNTIYHFEIEFDNNNSFYIDVLKRNENIIKNYGYIDYD